MPIEEGSREQLQALLERDSIDLDFVDPSCGRSPLQLAVDAAADAGLQTGAEPDVRVVEMLLRAGASPSFAGSDGTTAGAIASEYGWTAASILLGAR